MKRINHFRRIRLMFGNVAKGIILGVAGLGVATGFVLMNLNGESATCHENGYGDYNDAEGVCEVNGKYASNLTILAANTANSPKPYFTPKTASYDYLKNSLAKHAKIKIVSAATGNAVETISIEENKTNDATGFVESIDNAIQTINEKISQAPNANGARYYEGISKAGREAVSIKSTTNQEDKNDDVATIIVFGSGLSDGGMLNFADDDLLHRGVTSVLNALDRAGELVRNLNDITIIWSGIGQTVKPQEDLTNAEIATEKEIYQQILEQRGARVLFYDEMLDGDSVENNRYTVKPTKTVSIVEFGETQLEFNPGTADFKDKESAKAALSEIIEKAKASPLNKISITGYMAAGSCNGTPKQPTLAIDRAKTVKNLLIESGVENQIETIDGGVFEADKSECDKNGVWQSNLAEYRRKIVIEY